MSLIGFIPGVNWKETVESPGKSGLLQIIEFCPLEILHFHDNCKGDGLVKFGKFLEAEEFRH